LFEKGIKGLIFTTPIRLYCKDFTIKLALNHGLEITKALENFRFMPQLVDPCVFAEIINKTNIYNTSVGPQMLVPAPTHQKILAQNI
jgi:hypothetical protein